MNHWRRPLYTIETEFGTLSNVSQDDAEAFEHLSSDVPHKFILQTGPKPFRYYCNPLMVLLVYVVIVGLRYLIGG